ncbi:bifunctional diguanylate cyclase/phosphodiesterase [Alteromonas pelagimontana]|uniref:Bifunctional diguanylate cyclase/phosphodiesterase n=1 Tax=Alteromonas pelagimontana TaxID=1858656 RepID=A0A6M4MDC9_9ALTE|nr:bifunctional diguanylate cyclase/phosphodiesterase [Alteromonas pelagimontana]QJR80848.1 bifunctional diguanylate cyclase/phosphodiesterase [Alteromonas pelagimontana]
MERLTHKLIENSISRPLKARSQKDLAIIVVLTGLAAALCFSIDIDLLESFYLFTRAHESWELDEIIVLMTVIAILAMWFGARRLGDIKRINTAIATQGFIDPTSQLPNRVLSLERLSQMLDTSERRYLKLCVIFLDLDNFRAINDTYGNDKSDVLLKEVGVRLRKVIQRGDTLGRLGSDEFIILKFVNDEDELPSFLNAIQNTQNQPYPVDNQNIYLKFSQGISVFPKDGRSVSALLKAADVALFRAKQLGKAQFQFYTEALSERLLRQFQLELGLSSALKQNELHLVYQPQFNLTHNKIEGYETLLRWVKDGNVISPADFIPVAEQTGLIIEIGRWILVKSMIEMRPLLQAQQKLGVNISLRQFQQPDFVAQIEDVLRQTGFPAAQLELEITETAVALDFEETCIKLQKLRQLGVFIAIDDFGTGYSSLSRLRSLAVSRLKIDKAFIDRLADNEVDRNLVATIIALGKNLNLSVIAEGVESEEQVMWLRSLACDAIQGFYFSRPLRLEALEDVKQTISF